VRPGVGLSSTIWLAVWGRDRSAGSAIADSALAGEMPGQPSLTRRVAMTDATVVVHRATVGRRNLAFDAKGQLFSQAGWPASLGVDRSARSSMSTGSSRSSFLRGSNQGDEIHANAVSECSFLLLRISGILLSRAEIGGAGMAPRRARRRKNRWAFQSTHGVRETHGVVVRRVKEGRRSEGGKEEHRKPVGSRSDPRQWPLLVGQHVPA